MRRGTREVFLSSLSHTSFFFPITFQSSLLVSVCVLGYGWKRLDFDKNKHADPVTLPSFYHAFQRQRRHVKICERGPSTGARPQLNLTG